MSILSEILHSNEISSQARTFEEANELYINSLEHNYIAGDYRPLVGFGLQVITAELSFRMYLALAKKAKAKGFSKTANTFKALAYGGYAINCVTTFYHGLAHGKTLGKVLAIKSIRVDVTTID